MLLQLQSLELCAVILRKDLDPSLQRTGGSVLFGLRHIHLRKRRLPGRVQAKNAIEWHVNEWEVTLLISAVTDSKQPESPESCPGSKYASC